MRRTGAKGRGEHVSAEGRDSNERSRRKLISGTNTPTVEQRIIDAWDVSDEAAALPESEWAETVFEHGQWWITASNGAQWAVVDASGPGSIDGFAFERISEGEES